MQNSVESIDKSKLVWGGGGGDIYDFALYAETISRRTQRKLQCWLLQRTE